ncbi:MAG: hypothetical protein AAF797_00395 [Planctomycetota bacterium]
MSIRESLASRPWIPVVGACALLALSAYTLYSHLSADDPLDYDVFFYNLSSDELVSMPRSMPTPFTTEDGAVLLQATVYECKCDGETQQKVAYLMRLPDRMNAAKVKMQKGEQLTPEDGAALASTGSIQIATVEMAQQDVWVPRNSEKGREIAQSFVSCPAGCTYKQIAP